MMYYRSLATMVSKKKVITFYLDGKCVNSNYELRSGPFNDGLYRFWLFRTPSAAYPVLLNQFHGSSHKCWWAAQNAQADRSLPIPALNNEMINMWQDTAVSFWKAGCNASCPPRIFFGYATALAQRDDQKNVENVSLLSSVFFSLCLLFFLKRLRIEIECRNFYGARPVAYAESFRGGTKISSQSCDVTNQLYGECRNHNIVRENIVQYSSRKTSFVFAKTARFFFTIFHFCGLRGAMAQ